MKKIITIVLPILLGASIIYDIILYRRNMDTRNALGTRENKIVELNKKINWLNEETSKIYEQINDHAERAKEMEVLKKRISQLEGEIKVKDQTEYRLVEKIKSLEKEKEEKIKLIRMARSKLQDKDKKLAEFKEQLTKAGSRILSFEEQASKGQKEILEIEQRLSKLKKQRETDQAKYDQLKSTSDSQLSDFKIQINKKNAIVSELQKKLKNSQSRIDYIENQIEKSQSGLEKLRSEFSNLKEKKDMAESKISHLKSTHEAFIFNLQKQIENGEVTIKSLEEKISVSFVNRILFDFGKTTIAFEGRDILARVGDILKNIKDRKIRVIGHTDNIRISKDFQNKFPSNWELSAARASSVVRYFQKKIGIDPKNMEAMGRAFYEPIASNDTAEGRSRNRRVEIIIAPKDR